MGDLIEDPLLRDRTFVFSGRHDAGERLGKLLASLPAIRDPVVLAVPAGGVPVGRMIAGALSAPLALAVARKVRIPGTTESGFGAVTWDGSVLINERLREALGLSEREVERAVRETRKNVRRRMETFARWREFPPLGGKTAILTDDGLASGFTMLAAARSLRRLGPARVVVAVPTASLAAAELLRREVDLVVCLNVRTGRIFAVADAYREWHDLTDDEVIAELAAVS
ncbi:MAG: phosphoribosyltransferase family protein [Methanolinea sp.]|nr:phosphoribosyltransferase family protein [Methanolinea sp.]